MKKVITLTNQRPEERRTRMEAKVSRTPAKRKGRESGRKLTEEVAFDKLRKVQTSGVVGMTGIQLTGGPVVLQRPPI